MATSLNVGYGNWDDRWKYLDQVDYTPNEAIDVEDAGQVMPSARVPGVPHRRIEDYERTESHYTTEFGCANHKPMVKNPSIPRRTRVRGRMRAPSDFEFHHADNFWHESIESKSQVPYGENGFRMWGRINPAYCVNMYETSTQRAHGPVQPFKMPHDPNFSMEVRDKGYKEAVARQRNIDKDMKQNMKHVS